MEFDIEHLRRDSCSRADGRALEPHADAISPRAMGSPLSTDRVPAKRARDGAPTLPIYDTHRFRVSGEGGGRKRWRMGYGRRQPLVGAEVLVQPPALHHSPRKWILEVHPDAGRHSVPHL